MSTGFFGQWLRRNRFPPRCPGSMEECRGSDCDAAKEFSWFNVFVSISYNDAYKHRNVIRNVLTKQGFNALIVDEQSSNTKPLSMDICKTICKCAHAVVDFSNPAYDIPPMGVLTESGLLRSIMYNVLHLVDGNMNNLPAELKSAKYIPYKDKSDIQKEIKLWIERDLEWQRHLLENVLWPNNGFDSRIVYHCRGPFAHPKHHSPITAQNPPIPLSGGFTGSEILANVLRFLSSKRDCKLQDIMCTEITKCPPESTLNSDVKSLASNVNLLLLDAPIDAKGKLNWLLYYVLQEEANTKWTISPLSTHFKLFNKQELTTRPDEEKKIMLGSTAYYANPMYDYGIIARIPNPYTPKAFCLIMAGIHASASHAGAQIIADPYELSKLAREIGFSREEFCSDLLFEAVFRVNHTYCQEMLGAPKWFNPNRLTRRHIN